MQYKEEGEGNKLTRFINSYDFYTTRAYWSISLD